MNARVFATRALPTPRLRPRGAASWLLLGGLCAGTLDLAIADLYWIVVQGGEPARVLLAIPQAIASWAIGREQAIAGGLRSVVLGLLLHYTLMCAMVAGFHAACARWPRLLDTPLRAGAGYGAFLYLLVFVVLVPNFSAAEPKPMPPSWTLTCLLTYVLLVGMPCAWFARAARRN